MKDDAADAVEPGVQAPTPPAGEAPAELSPIDRIKAQATEAMVVEVLRTVYDPEIPVNIYDMGLIYGINVDASGKVAIRMTLTSPMCPVAESLPREVAEKVRTVDGVTDANVEVVWEPTWTPDKLSEAAKLQLNL